MNFTKELDNLSTTELESIVRQVQATINGRLAKRKKEKAEEFFVSLQSLADTYSNEMRIHICGDIANTFLLREIDFESSYLNEDGDIQICVKFDDYSF